MIKKSRQKFKYLDNEKSFYDELKSIFHHFQSAFIEANKTFFFSFGWWWEWGWGRGEGGQSPTWRSNYEEALTLSQQNLQIFNPFFQYHQ